jgi:hypothetical protein
MNGGLRSATRRSGSLGVERRAGVGGLLLLLIHHEHVLGVGVGELGGVALDHLSRHLVARVEVAKKQEKERLSGQRVPDVAQLVAEGLQASAVGDDGEIALALGMELIG